MSATLAHDSEQQQVQHACQQVQKLIEQSRDAEAEALTRDMLARWPNHPMPLVMMGHVMRVQQRQTEVIEWGRKLMAMAPDAADMTYMQGFAGALRQMGELKESIYYYLKAIQMLEARPNEAGRTAWVAEFLYGIGNAYDSMGDFTKAKHYYDMALAQAPQHAHVQFTSALLQMKCSNLRGDYSLYRTRHLAHPEQLRTGFDCPRWQGESLDGKRLFLWGEQGIGDMVMFAGFIPYLLQRAAQLTLEVMPSLVPLFARSFPDVQVVATGAAHHATHDMHAPMGDVLQLLDRYQPRAQAGYLKPDALRVSELKSRYAQDGKKLVGISWRTVHPETQFRRNVPLALWSEVLAVQGVRFVSLQYSGESEELAGVQRNLNLEILQDTTLSPTASHEDFCAQAAAMDAVISIQNSTVHVAGAMNVPALLLLPVSGDFRWGVSGSDSLLYPSVTIARQPHYGEWGVALQQAAQWLQQKVK